MSNENKKQPKAKKNNSNAGKTLIRPDGSNAALNTTSPDELNQQISELKKLQQIFDETEYNNYMQELEIKARETIKEKPYYQFVETELIRKQEESLKTIAVGSLGLFMDESRAVIKEINVMDDKTIECYIQGRRKTIAILHEPHTVYMDMKDYWVSNGLIGKIKLKIAGVVHRILGLSRFGLLKFNLYGIRIDGEYNINLSQDKTPWELQRRLEMFLKMQGKILKADIGNKLLTDMQEREKWWKNGMWLLTIVAIVFILQYQT